MGLDSVEFVIAIEDAFGIFIPDADAEAMLTPGILIDYLERRLTRGDAGCLEQRAFYRLRKAGMQVLDCARPAFQPRSQWKTLLHARHGARQWNLIGRVSKLAPWPSYGRFFGRGGIPEQTMGDTARDLATRSPQSLMYEGEGWSRQSIEGVVRRLMADELGITEFKLTDRFVQDLGVD